MQLTAHRAGNFPEAIPPALAVADVVEFDVHLFRGRLEVRHGKVLWPMSRLWETWAFLPAGTPRPSLGRILQSIPLGAPIWVDLKGFRSRLVRKVLEEVDPRREVTYSARSWWMLNPVRRTREARTMRSVGARWQLWAVQRVRSWGVGDGIVINERFITAEVIERLHRLTPTIVTWNATTLARAVELAGFGVSGLIVDDLGLIDDIDTAVHDR